MPDFTSSLYLGLDHGWSGLPPWPRLTLGKPAALQGLPGTRQVEAQLAELTGCEAALLGTSTLHLFLDLFAMLAKPGAGLFFDSGAYPVTRWCACQAVRSGVPLAEFPSHDVSRLRELLQRNSSVRPIVVTDGLSISSGRVAPLAAYQSLAARHGGLVVLDDTQALGILGRRGDRSQTGPETPYGAGGGGSAEFSGVHSPNLVVVASLAKAFGAPLAMIAGSAALIAHFRANSLTRMHCSPPSAAAVAAAAEAIAVNRRRGDSLRLRLAERVIRFERGIRRLGIWTNGSLFPVRPLGLPDGVDPRDLHTALEERGASAVLHRAAAGSARVSFVITARHDLTEIDAAIESLSDALPRVARKKRRSI